MGVRGARTARRSPLAVVSALVAVVWGLGGVAPPAAKAKPLTRYSIVHGCFALKPVGGTTGVARTGSGYTATATGVGSAEPFRMQATDLGTYLLYGPARDFMGLANGGAVIVATQPSALTEWTVTGDAGGFRFTNAQAGTASRVPTRWPRACS